jgi:hypothetical protein
MADLPITMSTTGAEQFAALASRLQREAESGLAQELTDQITQAVQPLPQAARANAISILPGSRRPNGLGQWLVQRTQIIQSDQTDSGTVTVRVTATSQHDIALIDSGTVIHPLFGDRRHWYSESVRPGWWSTPVSNIEPNVEASAEQAVDAVARRIEA